MITTLVATLETATALSGSVVGQVPDPSPVAPPGSDGILLVLGWAKWIGLIAGVFGFIAVGIVMTLQIMGRISGGGEYAGKLGWVAFGCIIIGASSALAEQFL